MNNTYTEGTILVLKINRTLNGNMPGGNNFKAGAKFEVLYDVKARGYLIVRPYGIYGSEYIISHHDIEICFQNEEKNVRKQKLTLGDLLKGGDYGV